MPVPNAYDTWTAAGAAYVLPPTPAVDDIDDPSPKYKLVNGRDIDITVYSPARREAWLKRNSASLALLRQGLKEQYQKPRANQFGINSQLRAMARMLVVESDARAQRGDYIGAADSALDCIELGFRCTRGCDLLGQALGFSINAYGYDALWRTMPRLDAPATDRALARLLRVEAERQPLSEVLRGEKAQWRRDFIGIMRSGQFPNYYFDQDSTGGRIRGIFANYAKIISDHDQHYDKLIALAGRPTASIAIPPADACSVSDPLNCDKSMMDSEKDDFLRNAEAKSEGKLLVVMLALRQYHFAHGCYPDWLNAIEPAAFKATCVDPFGTGGPFRYRRTGTSYLLYSVGPNGIDDHGQIDAAPNRSQLEHLPHRWLKWFGAGGDMVAFVN